MTRIRYTKDETTGNLISKPLPGTNGDLIVNLNPNGTFVINFKDGKLAVNQDLHNKLNIAKKLIRLELELLGVKFEQEVRTKLTKTEEN